MLTKNSGSGPCCTWNKNGYGICWQILTMRLHDVENFQSWCCETWAVTYLAAKENNNWDQYEKALLCLKKEWLRFPFVQGRNSLPADMRMCFPLRCSILFSDVFVYLKESTIKNVLNIHKIKQGILCKGKTLSQPDNTRPRKSLKLITAQSILILDYSSFLFQSGHLILKMREL